MRSINYKVRRVGEMSSIYAYEPHRFDEDVKRHIEQWNTLKRELYELLTKHLCTPEKARILFVEYLEEVGEI
jgi:hypothetical protein